MITPRAVPRATISEALVEPFKLLLEELNLSPEAKTKLQRAYDKSVDQQALLNDKLKAILAILEALVQGQVVIDETETTGVTSIGQPSLPMTGDVLLIPGTGILFSQAGQSLIVSAAAATQAYQYELPVQGPDISISGTTFMAITAPVAVQSHGSSVRLSWYWEAGNAAVFAQARLYNATTLETILEWAEAAPFSRTLVELTDPALVMPSAGDEVELQVCFSAAGSGGEIEMTGPAVWEVA